MYLLLVCNSSSIHKIHARVSRNPNNPSTTAHAGVTHTHTHKLLMTSTHLSCFGSTLDQHVNVLQALNFICTHQSGLENSCSTNSSLCTHTVHTYIQ